MEVTSISDFRKQTKRYFNQVIDDQIPLLITRSDGAVIVAVPLEQYNSFVETEYLNRSPAMRRHLSKSIAQLRAGQTVTRTMKELKSYEQAG